MKKKMISEICRRLCAVAMGMVLAAASVQTAGMPVHARSVGAGQAIVQELIDAGDYIEGEAIVVMRGNAKPEGVSDTEMLSKVDADSVKLALEYADDTDAEVYEEAEGRIHSVSDRSYTIRHVADHGRTTEELLNQLYEDPDVIAAEPNYTLETAALEENAANTELISARGFQENAGDLSFMQWYANDATAAGYKTPGAPLGDARTLGIPGWNQTEDNASGTICIMDTGIDTSHPDLKDSLYTFTEEQQEKYGCGPYGVNMNQKGDGSGDEAYRKDVSDHFMHGTHLAGIIAGSWNKAGISGIEKGAKIFAVRVFADDGMQQGTTDVLRGFEWLTQVAKDVNLKAVNVSLGSMKPQLAHVIMVNKLGELGVNTVYASGNSGSDMDETIDMGGMNNSPYAITVNAADQDGKMAHFSCYGQMSTDVFAAGTQILSTVPDMVKKFRDDGVLSDYQNYHLFLPEATKEAHLAGGQMERFRESVPSVKFFDACPVKEDGTANSKAKEIGSIVSGGGLGFDDGSSWGLNAKSLPIDGETVMVSHYMAGRSVWMAVPVEDAKKSEWLGLRACVNDGSHVYAGIAAVLGASEKSDGSYVPVKVDMSYDNAIQDMDFSDASYPARGLSNAASGNISNVQWTPYILNLKGLIEGADYVHGHMDAEDMEMEDIKDPGKLGGIYVWEQDGQKYLLMEYAFTRGEGTEQIGGQTMLYFDNIAVGDSDSAVGAYYYLSGTSMAAPAVSACLSIIAKDEPQSASLSDGQLKTEALERKGKLLACVDYDEDLAALCRTGGRVNLHGQTEFSKKAPIITRAETGQGVLELSGYFLGTEGRLFIDGAEVTALKWTDNQISADVSKLDGGSHIAKVVNQDEAVSQVLFNVVGKDAGLYEKTYSLPLGNPQFLEDDTDCFDGNLVELDGSLYAMACDHIGKAYALWRFDRDNDSWTRCKDLPKKLKGKSVENNSLAVYHGAVYVYSCRDGLENIDPMLYRYLPSKDSWKKISIKKLPGYGQIFAMDNGLFVISDEMNIIQGKTEDDITYEPVGFVKINLKAGKVKKVSGRLPENNGFSEFRFAVSGKKLYALGWNYEDGDVEREYVIFARMTYKKAKNKFKVQDISKAIDSSFGDNLKDVALAGLPNGAAIIGSPADAKDSRDTHIIRNGKKKATLYPRTSSFHTVFGPMAVYAGDSLYVLGTNPTEPDVLYLRSTQMGDSVKTGKKGLKKRNVFVQKNY